MGDVATGFDYGINAPAIPYDGKHKYIRITDIDESSHAFNANPLTSPDGAVNEKYRVKERDILFARTGASVGKNYLYKSSDGALYFAGFLIRAHIKETTDSRFVYYSTFGRQFKRWVKVTSARSGQPGINADEYASYLFNMPGFAEQQKIASFLAILDSRISTQRKLVELLKKHKRGLLNDIFSLKNGIPKLRFNGFSGRWISSPFSAIFTFVRNNTYSRAEMSNDEGRVRNIHYGDVLVKYGECVDFSRDEIPYITLQNNVNADRCLKEGDIVIADTAEDEMVGKAAEIVSLGEQLAEAGLHTIACRPQKKFAARFLGYYLNAPAYHRQLMPLMQGVKVLSINKSQIAHTTLIYPKSIEEQLNITNLLTSLDDRVSRQERLLMRLQTLKAGLLQQLFV